MQDVSVASEVQGVQDVTVASEVQGGARCVSS